MAMVVKNNMSAVSTLNTLNKNSSALQKSLQKVSSGMKINSAQDDASGYAISEKMRVQIRSLDQANQNTQNASSLMKTAEGAVSSTVEILKSLKEKAINAATDTNTDSDRATIQKEIDQFIDQIDDNALTTFNGKYLVDGSKNNAHMNTRSAFTNQSLDIATTGQTYLAEDNTAGSTDVVKNRLGESLEINSTDYVTASFVKDGKTYTTTYQVADTKVEDIFNKLNDEYAAQEPNATAPAFGPSSASGGATTDSDSALIEAASDKDLADVVAGNSTDSDLKAALAAKASDLATALTSAQTALTGELTGKTVAAQTSNAKSSISVDGGATKVVEGTANKTEITLDADQAKAVTNAVSAAAASATGITTANDVSQAVAGNVQIEATGGTVDDVLSATNDKFHALTRAALADAAAKAATPVEIEAKTLASGSTEAITADNSDTVIAAAGSNTFADADLQAIASAINSASGSSGSGAIADLDSAATGETLVAAVQTALKNTTVQSELNAAAADNGVTLDKYNHQVDAAVATALNASGSLSTGTTPTNTATAAHDSDTAAPTELVHSGTDIGTNKSGDQVDTNDGTTGLTVTASTAGVKGQISGVTISISDSDGNVKKSANAALDQFSMSIRAENRTTSVDGNNNLSFQVGANANQSIAVSLTDMRSEALGLKGSDGTKVSVATQDKANAAVAVFDNAIQKAIDQQTTIGAVESRLDYTSSNLTTSSENVQAAESTIRDADMAKEMTNYTKNNVLLQAAQSMLAQANQSSSAVLSLLQ